MERLPDGSGLILIGGAGSCAEAGEVGFLGSMGMEDPKGGLEAGPGIGLVASVGLGTGAGEVAGGSGGYVGHDVGEG